MFNVERIEIPVWNIVKRGLHGGSEGTKALEYIVIRQSR